MAVNPSGSVVTDGTNSFWASPYEVNKEFGGKRFEFPKKIFLNILEEMIIGRIVFQLRIQP